MGACRILSTSGRPFQDRAEAGRLLSRELQDLAGEGTVVLGIPRGGVVLAREVAHGLGAGLDIVLSRKLGAPYNPELAIGAVAEDGKVFLNEEMASLVGGSADYIEGETRRQRAEIARRSERYRSVWPKAPLAGKAAVVTDDGVATGATMQAALWAARQEGPRRLVVAIPVGPEQAVRRLAEDADEVVCLRAPAFFEAVGQFYVSFEQIEDEELLSLLREEAGGRGPA